jgi:pyridoxine/pyridoxamine 5'-phosphate oxidase
VNEFQASRVSRFKNFRHPPDISGSPVALSRAEFYTPRKSRTHDGSNVVLENENESPG